MRNQEVVVPDGYIAVGHIVNVHGLRGEIRVEPYTDFPERFAPGERLLMGVDLVEVNPVLDERNRTAVLAVDLIESLFGKSTLMRLR